MESLKDAIQEKHRLACEELEREKRVGPPICLGPLSFRFQFSPAYHSSCFEVPLHRISKTYCLSLVLLTPRRKGTASRMPELPPAPYLSSQMIEEARNIAEEEKKRLSEELRERIEQQEAQRQVREAAR